MAELAPSQSCAAFSTAMMNALGLGDKTLRSLRINMTIDEIVTLSVTYEEFVEEDTLKLVAKTFELGDWKEQG